MRTIPGPGDEAPSRGGGMLFAGAARRKASRALAWIVEGSLAGCIFAVPFALGGRHPLGEALLVAFALAAAVAWGARQCLEIEATWRRTPGLGLWLAGLVVVAVQITPLPSAVTGWLQPAMRHWLPLWVGGADEKPFLGPWNTLSLTPAETRSALVVLLAYGLLFVITVQRTRSIEDLERLLRWTALAAVAMAIFGLVQYFTANGRFFWFSEQPYATTAYNVKGSFTNRNHFAHFLALGLGPLTWWLHHSGWRGASGGCSPARGGSTSRLGRRGAPVRGGKLDGRRLDVGLGNRCLCRAALALAWRNPRDGRRRDDLGRGPGPWQPLARSLACGLGRHRPGAGARAWECSVTTGWANEWSRSRRVRSRRSIRCRRGGPSGARFSRRSPISRCLDRAWAATARSIRCISTTLNVPTSSHTPKTATCKLPWRRGLSGWDSWWPGWASRHRGASARCALRDRAGWPPAPGQSPRVLPPARCTRWSTTSGMCPDAWLPW